MGDLVTQKDEYGRWDAWEELNQAFHESGGDDDNLLDSVTYLMSGDSTFCRWVLKRVKSDNLRAELERRGEVEDE